MHVRSLRFLCVLVASLVWFPGLAGASTDEPREPVVLEAVDPGRRVDGGMKKAMDELRKRTRGRHSNQDRVAMGNSITVRAGESVKDVVAFGGTVVVEEGAVVRGDAVAFGGTVEILSGGTVAGDVVAFGGSVIVRDGAIVYGDTNSFGGSIEVEDGATIGGSRVGIGGPLGEDLSFEFGNEDTDEGSVLGRGLMSILSTTSQFLVALVVGLLLLVIMPRRMDRVRRPMAEHPGKALLAGFLTMIGCILLGILLLVSIIGSPLVLVLALVVVALVFMGWATVGMATGRRLLRNQPGHRSPAIELFIGMLALWFIGLLAEIPILGVAAGVALLVGTFIGVGSVVLARFGNAPRPTAGSIWPEPEPPPSP